ncbi:MAG: deoxyribonucleoside regulator [Actinomycetota bacterium]|jgi:DNA-binding transcriptional regulator LsrR (DeoR family)|nr:deoxyribonucleoside regulator [Actinomycetota bacterium]
MNDQQRRQAAHLHYEHDLDKTEIAAALGVPRREVGVGIREARKRNLVRVEVQDLYGSAPRLDVELGERLARRFRLSRAVVVKVDDDILAGEVLDSDTSADLAAADRASDEIHHQLGRAAGEFLYQFVNGEHDSVAVGAGRGVHFTIRTLREQVEEHAPRLGRLEIFSVVGAMWVRTHSLHERAREYVDADQNALELADIFEVPWSRVHLAWLPRLYLVGDVAEKAQVIAKVSPHLQGDDWKGCSARDEGSVTLSLFGCGVVNDRGHYMMREWGPQTAAVEEIQHLRDVVLPADPTAVVDVCDRFWLRAEADLPDDVRQEAQTIVDRLNDLSVAATLAKLNSAHRRCLVAGGASKLEAISEILRHGTDIGLTPDILVTDSVTAGKLLAGSG